MIRASRILPLFLLASLTLSAATACHERLEIIDTDGYHHRGYYDQRHEWHGGYYDRDNRYHDDPHDWHRD